MKIPAFAMVLAFSAAAQTGTWVEGAKMPTARSEIRAVVVNGLAYVAGGADSKTVVEAYDLAGDKWKTVASLPEGLDHYMMAGFDNKVYVMKGKTWVYDPYTDQWTEKAGSDFRGDGTAVTLGNHIYVMGGGPMKMQRYSPSEDKWTDLAPLKTYRGHTHAVALGGKIYALAGRNNDGALRSVEIYDTTTKVWTDGISMQDVRSGFAAEVIGGKIVVAGGEIYEDGKPKIVKSAEIFDPATGKWSYLPELPTPIHGIASTTMDGKFYLFGGSLQPFAIVDSDKVFILDVSGSTGLQRNTHLGIRNLRSSETPYTVDGRLAKPLESRPNFTPQFYLAK